MAMRILLWVCFGVAIAAMLVCAALKGFWVTMGAMALDAGPIPWFYLWNAFLFCAYFLSPFVLWFAP